MLHNMGCGIGNGGLGREPVSLKKGSQCLRLPFLNNKRAGNERLDRVVWLIEKI